MKRQYREIAPLLQVRIMMELSPVHLFQAVNELAGNFKTFRNIKQISDLLDTIATLQAEVKRMVFNDFEGRYCRTVSMKSALLSQL